MDLIKMTRELGAAIQQDERYLAFAKAREDNENDAELMGIMGQLQMLQMNFQRENEKEEPDTEKLQSFNAEFEKAYQKFISHEKMKAYEQARAEIDNLMNNIMEILGMCVNGADPMTCEPHKHEGCDCGCSGSCSSCDSEGCC